MPVSGRHRLLATGVADDDPHQRHVWQLEKKQPEIRNSESSMIARLLSWLLGLFRRGSSGQASRPNSTDRSGQPLSFTPKAVEMLRNILIQNAPLPTIEGAYVRVSLEQLADGEYKYRMGYDQAPPKIDEHHWVQDGLAVCVARYDAFLINGTVVDYIEQPVRGFTFDNPKSGRPVY
jgi:Fe-S cluster assembly iron-binding protein IscA